MGSSSVKVDKLYVKHYIYQLRELKNFINIHDKWNGECRCAASTRQRQDS